MMRIPLLVLAGFASGVVVAAGTFAFIAAIGIVPRMAQRTNTKQYIPFMKIPYCWVDCLAALCRVWIGNLAYKEFRRWFIHCFVAFLWEFWQWLWRKC